MTIAEYIFDFLKDKIDVVFLVTGGQAMYLNDALLRSGIRYICTHHEQAAGMAAEAYGRLTGKLGVVLVTAGPGSINVLNGVVGGYMDSSPMMVISGQSPAKYLIYMQKNNIRQHGIQGINICPIVYSVTKRFLTAKKSEIFKKQFKDLYKKAFDCRPGPVWLDIPLDVQNENI